MARGGARGGGNRFKDMPRDQLVSRKLSWLLRHGAKEEGLQLGKGGYVGVGDAVSLKEFSSFDNCFFSCVRVRVCFEDLVWFVGLKSWFCGMDGNGNGNGREGVRVIYDFSIWQM